MKTDNRLFLVLIALLTLTLQACSSGSSDGDDDGGITPPEPADRFVVSGNADGTLSVLRANPVAGFATAMSFVRLSAFPIRDLHYLADDERLLALDSQSIHDIVIERDSGVAEGRFDQALSATGATHLVTSADEAFVYVATGSGAGGFIDIFSLDPILSPLDSVATGIDPDYIQLSPDGDFLYLVSSADAAIEIYGVNADGTLAAGPQTFATASAPSALIFHPLIDVAYLGSNDNSANLRVLDVDPATGDLSDSGSSFDIGNNAIDLVLSDDALHLYVLETGNKGLHHFGVDAASGALAAVAAHNISFEPTDLRLSATGEQLYISHSDGDLVSTSLVDPADGTLDVRDFTRVFDAANAVAAIGGDGALTPTPTFLLAPDETGLNRFSIDASGGLDLDAQITAAGALITGQVRVDYLNELLFGAGSNAAAEDRVTSYLFDPFSGITDPGDNFVGSFDPDSDFQRLEVGRSGRFLYVQDHGNFGALPPLAGEIRAYAYDGSDNITDTPIDTQATGEGPENLTLSPSGRYIYSINSFDDDIRWYEISEIDGTLGGGGTATPGGTGSGQGRPIDLVFHPNGRYAYVSLEDDSELGRYQVSDDGSLNNITRFNTATSNGGTDTDPSPLAMHPSGLYLFAGERGNDRALLVTAINPSASYSLSFEQRLPLTELPTWLEPNPAGDKLYVRYADESIEVFDFDAASGQLASTGEIESAGADGGFLGTLTLVAPLR